MISHARRCIFVHQRKCAGTSIIRAFGLTPADPDWHFLNDGVLSPEYGSAPAGYFRFAVVRNPWDRFVSGWKYCPGTRDRTLPEVLANLPQDGHDYRHLTRPQHLTLYDPSGRLAVDQLLRFETLQQDFDRVCDRIGIPRCVLPQLNRGRHGAYAYYFTADTRALFLQHFGRDVELFGYTF